MEGREAVVGSARDGKKLNLRTNSDGISRGDAIKFLAPTGGVVSLFLYPLRFADLELKGGIRTTI